MKGFHLVPLGLSSSTFEARSRIQTERKATGYHRTQGIASSHRKIEIL